MGVAKGQKAKMNTEKNCKRFFSVFLSTENHSLGEWFSVDKKKRAERLSFCAI